MRAQLAEIWRDVRVWCEDRWTWAVEHWLYVVVAIAAICLGVIGAAR